MFAVEHGKVQTENKAREGKKGGWGLCRCGEES
jgi:hypothetical protein